MINYFIYNYQKESRKIYYHYDNNTNSMDPSFSSKTFFYSEAIKEHVERRVHLFFLQLIMCHKTKLTFDLAGALHQGEPSKRQNKKEKFQSAHSATLPCLIVEQENKKYVFLKNSFYYYYQNSTISLPDTVNKVDILIDKQLRASSLNLLNAVSCNKLTPKQGIKKFIYSLKQEVEGVKIEKKGKEKKIYKKVLSIYLSVLKDLEELDNKDFAYLLGMKLFSKKAKKFFDRLSPLLYERMRNAALAQSKIMKKIEDLRKEVLVVKNKKKVVYFDQSFKIFLIENIEKKEVKTSIEKISCFSISYFEKVIQSRQRGKVFQKTCNLLKEKTKKNWKDVNKAIQEISEDIEKYHKQEKENCCRLVKKIRKIYGYTQEELSKKVNRKFPDKKIHQSTLSKIENCKEMLSSHHEKQLSEVFGINSFILKFDAFF